MKIIADIPYEIGDKVEWERKGRFDSTPIDGESIIKAIGIWFNGSKPKVTFYCEDDERVDMTLSKKIKVVVENSNPTYTQQNEQE